MPLTNFERCHGLSFFKVCEASSSASSQLLLVPSACRKVKLDDIEEEKPKSPPWRLKSSLSLTVLHGMIIIAYKFHLEAEKTWFLHEVSRSMSSFRVALAPRLRQCQDPDAGKATR